MKKVLLLFAIVFTTVVLSACGGNNTDVKDDPYQDLQDGIRLDICGGSQDFVVIDGSCVVISDYFHDSLTLNEDGSVTVEGVNYESLDTYVADLTDSVGLAVMPKTQYDQTQSTSARYSRGDLPGLTNLTDSEDAENVLVKLTDEGVFEEIDFRDENGELIDITSNPLALEVYGPFTIVIFEVNNNNYYDVDSYTPNFQERVWNSLNSGGIYLIHNASGKLFATKDILVEEVVNTWTEDYSRWVDLQVTLGEPIVEVRDEPIFDELGKQVFDDFGNPVYQQVETTVLDENGEPLIYYEGDGPLETEFIEEQLVEYWEVPIEVEGEYKGFVLEDVRTNGITIPEEVIDQLSAQQAEELNLLASEFNLEGFANFTDDELKQSIEQFIQIAENFFNNNNLNITVKQDVEIVEVPITDEDGNPVIQTMEVPVTDSDGNFVYQQTFTVNMYINDVREMTQIYYNVQINETPLSEVAQKFVDQVLNHYYDWSYYRVHNYMLSSWGFATDTDAIYYIENTYENDENQQQVKKMSFDSETNELVLEDYLDVTKAGFDNSELIFDPNNDLIVSRSWDYNDNLKIYSATEGLKTIPDSENLQPVTFPNGDLFFFKQNTEYVEELGYWTTMLYTISPDGTLNEHFIELGESYEVCYGNCQSGFNVDVFDQNGVQINDEYNNIWLNMEINDGDPYIKSADLTLISLEEFDATRQACDSSDCYYNVLYHILDEDGNELQSFNRGFWSNSVAEAPPFEMTYQLTTETNVQYSYVQSQNDRVCDNDEFGCSNNFSIFDPEVGQDGMWFGYTSIIESGDTFIQNIQINEDSNAVYEYSRDVVGDVCEFSTCEEYVRVVVFNLDGEEVYNSSQYMSFEQGETIPLRIEYSMSENTQTEDAGLCTSSGGCYVWYPYQDNNFSFSVYYDQGDMKYDSIVFAETDVLEITSETEEAEVCLENYGCYREAPTTYIFLDSSENEVYRFEQNISAPYGYRVPFTVTVSLDTDATIEYAKEYSQDIEVCNDETCNRWVDFVIDLGNGMEDYIGNKLMTFNQGEQVISRYTFPVGTEPVSTVEENLCNEDAGCQIGINTYTILDENGVEVPMMENYYNWIYVNVAKGEKIPVNYEGVSATFEMTNLEYQTRYIDPYTFMYSINQIVVLDENLYLIENNSYDNGENIILRFDEESNNYFASYTNLSSLIEITPFGDGFIAINDSETGIIQFTYNEELSSKDYYYFDEVNLTEGVAINAANELIVDYDGTVYFKGVDNFVQDITGTILSDGTIVIDTEVVEREVIRLTPIN
jgi:hypothetical protein